jgi:hypothetical protein
MLVALPVWADDDDCFDPDASQIDIIEPFIVEHRETPLPCKPGLTFSGNVRTGYRRLSERIGSQNILGKGSATAANPAGLAKQPVRIEFNLNFDYRGDYTWATVKVGYGNGAGVISGDVDGLGLSRALFGITLYEGCAGSLMAEVGRKPFSDAFRSEVMCGSRIDGLYGRWEKGFEGIGVASTSAAYLVADYRVNYWAWAYGATLREIFCSGAYVEYINVDWYHGGQGPGRIFQLQEKNTPPITELPGLKDSPKWSYVTSQLQVGYKFPRIFLCNSVDVFGALLYNWAARRSDVAQSRYPLGFYAGVWLGKVQCPGDWSLKVLYQYVEPQAILEKDLAGITIGNNRKTSMYDQLNSPPAGGIDPNQANGPSNYKGWSINAAYGVIDDLTVELLYEAAKEAVATIGGRHYYSRFEVKTVYAF